MTGTSPSSILLLLTTPAWRGSGVSFAKIARGLTAAGHPVTVVAASDEVATGLSEAGVADVCLLDLPDSGPQAVRRLAALHHEKRWQLTIADAPRDLRLAGSVGLPHLVWRFNLHSRLLPDDLLSRWRFRRVCHLVAQSEFAAVLAQRAAPRLAQRGMTIIPNGYDLDRLTPDAARGMAWRDRRGISREVPLLVTVGALSPEKALPEVLALGDRLVERTPDLCQIIVGGGDRAAPLVGTARPHCRFLGECPPEETRDALRAADIVVQLAPGEIFPNVVAEAMALGRVVLAPTSGAASEIVGDAGVLLPLAALGSQVDAIEALLRHPGERDRIGEAARTRIGTLFPIERMIARYDALVRHLLGGAPPLPITIHG